MSKAQYILGDADIRPALRADVLAKHAGEVDTRIIEELGLCRGQSRVDLAVVNGALHGYEIKSERDSLRRLEHQIKFYGQVLDRATLVVGECHVAKSLDLLPDWWGVLRIHPMENRIGFKSVRRGRFNPSRDPRSIVELLWLDDAVELLAQRGAARGIRGKPRSVVWDRICEFLDVDEISETVRSHLKARTATQAPPSRT